MKSTVVTNAYYCKGCLRRHGINSSGTKLRINPFDNLGDIDVTDGIVKSRNSSATNSALCYYLDKAQYLGLEFFAYPLLFPNKKTDTS